MKRLITTVLVLVVLILFTSQSYAAVPGVPGAPNATLIAGTSFQANWSASTNSPLSYILDVATTSTFTAGTFVGTYNALNVGLVTNYSVAGLTNNTTYYFRVRATNASGTSANSSTITVTTIPLAPAPPVAAAATLPTTTGFTASWAASATATGYWLDVSSDPAFGVLIAGYSNLSLGNVLTKAVSGLASGVTYYYRVRAGNAGGTSASSNIITITTVPAVPTALAAGNFTATSFTANWQAVTGATGYYLDVGTSSGGTQLINNANAGNATSVVVGGVPGTRYYYQVRAYNSSGTNATNSNVIIADMVPASATPTGTNTRTSTSFIATWTAPVGNVTISGYYLDVATDSAFTNILPGYNNLNVGNVTSYTVTGVSVGTDYYIRVRAYNASGIGSNSGTAIGDISAPTITGITAGTSSSDSTPVDLTLGTLGGPYVKTLTPFITVKFSEPVIGIAYGASPSIKMTNPSGTVVTLASTYTPATNATSTPAGNPSPATFQGAAALSNSTKYTITITGGTTASLIHDLALPTGNPLTSSGPYYFTVDVTNPTVASVSPANGATGVNPSQAITVVFNENCVMDYRTYTGVNIQLTDSDGKLITTSLASGVSPYTTLTITPATALEYNTTYTLTLSNIKDAAGNLLGGTGSYTTTFTTQMLSSTTYSMVPSFLSAPVTPNVLIILDNSNSMDETLTSGDAIGSFNCTDPNDLNTCSRSVLARRALIDLVNTYAGKVNIGLMSYNLPTDTDKSHYLYNSYYFASYDPRTYCGINPPPQACYNYCVNENPKAGIAGTDYTPSTDEADCNSACQTLQTISTPVISYIGTQNTHFQANIREPIINGTSDTNGSAINSNKRKSYCGTIYPKTASTFNTANNLTIYHALPGTFYDTSSTQGTRFLYSGNPPGSAYSPQDSASNSYTGYNNRAAAATPPYDGYVGYSSQNGGGTFIPTDDDKALGFYNFGQAMTWYPPNNGAASKTWFSNTSANPASGFLHVPATINLSDNVQLNKLLTKIGTSAFKNNEAGYMACTSTGSSANRCSYIVNAGLTPTAGTLQSAIDYFNGALAAGQTQDNSVPASPILNACQKTFVIYVTDGLASVDSAGGTKDSGGNLYTASALTTMSGGVLDKLNKLRCPTGATAANCGVSKIINGTNVKYDVKTYVLGLAISPQSSPLLDSMAVTGGTDKNGKAYYANDATSLNNSLIDIFQNIFAQLSAGTAASILNNSEGSGANMLQAVFYPSKTFDSNSQCGWVGEMQNLWYFLDPNLQNTSIREDTDQDNVLSLKKDKITQFYFDTTLNKTRVNIYSDANGDGAADNLSLPDNTIDPDKVKSLWKAGMLLWNRDVTSSGDPRTIYTGYNSSTGYTPQLLTSSLFDTAAKLDLLQIPATLTFAQRQAKAGKLLNWVSGADQANDADGTTYRSRLVNIKVCSNDRKLKCDTDSECTINGVCGTCLLTNTHEWKLGDIISSTPKLVSNVKLNSYSLSSPNGYNDKSYADFLNTSTYKNRGMVFVGSNDGMLHAFRLGILKELSGKYVTAQINNSSGVVANDSDNIGREEWAFVPKNVLPFLTFLTSPSYRHLYFVDRTPSIADVSIGVPSGCSGDYSSCSKDASTWRTVLIGGMGIGGAVKSLSDSCTAPTNCVKVPVDGIGYSSYFALDVTDPTSPKYMWEFNGDPNSSNYLGYSTTGPAIVRISQKDSIGNPDHSKNGKWYAVFASGPTGPIDTTLQAFLGQSDQNLKIFIVDLTTGVLVKTIDTGIANAFAGSLSSSVIDTDKSNLSAKGFYSDDAIYIGYVQKDTSVSPNTWTKGGVVRVFTKESNDPASTDTSKQWTWSSLISGIGPVTTSVTKLQDKLNSSLWIYFGTGRYFFKNDDPTTGTTQSLYGVKEPCYSTADRKMTTIIPGGTYNNLDSNCSDSVITSSIVNQSGSMSSAPASTLASTAGGWRIDLDAADSSSFSERLITDPVASPSGAVFFTTFKPSGDICKFGGNSLLWAVNYSSGGIPPAAAMKGKALIQVSTGAFAEISLSSAFANPGNSRLDGRRSSASITGVPPTGQGLSIISNPPAVKKFLHVREK